MAKSDTFPTSFDVVVCGTGLTESMIAASLSRIGKKVLHIDRNDYYGSHWATFSFQGLLEWVKKYELAPIAQSKEDKPRSEDKLDNNFNVPLCDSCVSNVVVKSRIPLTIQHNDMPVMEAAGIDESLKKTAEEDSSESDDRTYQTVSEEGEANADDPNKLPTEISKKNSDGEVEGKQAEGGTGNDAEKLISINQPLQSEKKAPQSIVSQAKVNQGSADISLEDFIILSRKFNLDITPKFLFSAGPLVQTIIKANIAHYAEFKVVNRNLMCRDEKIIEVPCNRADVFNSTFLTMIEKRMLMKFLTFCVEFEAESDEIKIFKDKPFHEFLKSKRLSDNLQKFVIYSITMVKPETEALYALQETQTFLKSLGRFGKSPFIWPLYGVGELPQAFCRMSAVFGGLYCLHTDVQSIEINDASNECTHIVVDGQHIECQQVVMESSYLPGVFLQSNISMISKALLITNKSLVESTDENISFLTIPPLPGKEELVQVVELGPASSACPSGLFVLYLTCLSTSVAVEDLEDYVKLLTHSNDDDNNTSKPELLWSLYFNHLNEVVNDTLPRNIMVTSMPGSALGFSQSVEEAEEIFTKICPNEEFMLKVPNPEDIIWDHDAEEIKVQDTGSTEGGKSNSLKEKFAQENELPEASHSTENVSQEKQ